MTGGPAVPRSSSGQCLIALRRHHGRGANARRSAGACPAAWRETPRTGHQCRCPAACGFSEPVQTPAGVASPAGSHSPAGGSGDRRTRPDDVQPENPAGAVPTLEPQPLSAKPARRPGGGNMLLAAPAVRRYCVGRRLPGRRWLKVALPAPFQHIDGPATLDGVLVPVCGAVYLGTRRTFVRQGSG
jgi:hypothetical protein